MMMMSDEVTALSKGVFSEDYAHFEQNHAAFPVEAQSVFRSVTDLRAALNAFRKATENTCVVDDEVAVSSVLPTADEEKEAAGEVIVRSASVEAATIEETDGDESTPEVLLAEASLDSPTRVTDVSFLDS